MKISEKFNHILFKFERFDICSLILDGIVFYCPLQFADACTETETEIILADISTLKKLEANPAELCVLCDVTSPLLMFAIFQDDNVHVRKNS